MDRIKSSTWLMFICLISIVLISSSLTNNINTGTDFLLTQLDSLLLEKYTYEVQKAYVEDAESLTREEVDSIFAGSSAHVSERNVMYSPDKSFKIFAIELEDCGAYCNSEWYSWIHFNLKKKEVSRTASFAAVDAIYKLPDNKYLILNKSQGRSASVLTVSCFDANVVSFTADSMIVHPVQYKNKNHFSFCQESDVEFDTDPYIRYDTEKQLLSYSYGTHNLYTSGRNTNIIRQGHFKYTKGRFVLEKETITVQASK